MGMSKPESTLRCLISIRKLQALLILKTLAHWTMLVTHSKGHVISGVIDFRRTPYLRLALSPRVFILYLHPCAIKLNELRLEER
jgi:hypothetical protein